MNTPFSLLAFGILLLTSNAYSAVIELFAGGGSAISGPATNCSLRAPFATDSDENGNVYIAEMAGGERILKVDPNGNLTVIAGTAKKGDTGDGGPAAQATFNGAHHLALGPHNTLLIADTWNSRIRSIDLKSGLISPFAGTGQRGFSGDNGPAIKAEFGNVYCLASDASAAKLYVDDLDNRRIRAIDLKSGTVSTVAGNGERGVPKDGSNATESPLVDPRAIAVDSQHNLYILERSGHALRRVDSNGKIQTVAGTGKQGFEDGEALRAGLNEPKHICADAQNNVIIADTDNHLIRKYIPSENKVVRIAGTGKSGSRLDADPNQVELNQPHGVHMDSQGVLYIADSLNNRVLRLRP